MSARVRGRRKTAGSANEPLTPLLTADFRVSMATGILALVCMAGSGAFGDVHGPTLSRRLIALAGAGVFLILAIVAVRHAGAEMHRVLAPRVGASHAGVVRLLINLFGLTVAMLATLGLLAVPVKHLLLGGALTGIIVGIAAQQALGNVFAGLVLLLARPFNVADRIRMRHSTLGGELQGRVIAMGLTYVTLETADGPLSVPNSLMLGAGIGPDRSGEPDRTAQQGSVPAHDRARHLPGSRLFHHDRPADLRSDWPSGTANPDRAGPGT
ncbi:MAG TPA: mechanosensitive ion channel family protein [Sporichthyaceae bacterium]|jgi:small-conductance mechanosensitive channel|nr:mechanosensitive ion channel family protein [Sporichthyaceae bacterium]